MRHLAVVVVFIATCASRVARADSEPTPGPFVDVAVGAGYASGVYTVDGLGVPGPHSVTVAAPTAALTLTPGWAWPKFAIGAMFDATIITAENSLPYEYAETWVITSASPAFLWKPTPHAFGPEAAFALGYASAWHKAYGTDAIQLNGPWPTYGFESTEGIRLAVRFGPTWPIGFGIAATAWGAYLTGEHSKYVPFGAALQATLSSW